MVFWKILVSKNAMMPTPETTMAVQAHAKLSQDMYAPILFNQCHRIALEFVETETISRNMEKVVTMEISFLMMVVPQSAK